MGRGWEDAGWTDRVDWTSLWVVERFSQGEKKKKRMKRWARFLRPPTLKRTQKLHEERAKIIGSFEKIGAQTSQETTMHRFGWWPGPKVDERGNKIASMDGWDDTHTHRAVKEKREDRGRGTQLWVEFHPHDTVSLVSSRIFVTPLPFSETNT